MYPQKGFGDYINLSFLKYFTSLQPLIDWPFPEIQHRFYTVSIILNNMKHNYLYCALSVIGPKILHI